MKRITMIRLVAILVALALAVPLMAQNSEPATEAAEDLDLYGVAELLQQAESLEDFENKLNDQATEVNNLDLNGDQQVDYIAVIEESEGDTHVAILRALLGENESQDVASVEMEKVSSDEIAVQIVGDEELYGADYIVEPSGQSASAWQTIGGGAQRVGSYLRGLVQSPTMVSVSPGTLMMAGGVVVVRVGAWPVLGVVFRPGNRIWRSPFRWGFYPRVWRPWRPVARSTYRARHARWSHARWNRTKVRHSSRARTMTRTHRKTTTMSRHTPRTAAGPNTGPNTGPKTAAPATRKAPATQQKKAPPKKKSPPPLYP